jgi:hypothetical protein
MNWTKVEENGFTIWRGELNEEERAALTTGVRLPALLQRKPHWSFYERLFIGLAAVALLAALAFSPFDRVAFCIFAVVSMWASSLGIALGSRRDPRN